MRIPVGTEDRPIYYQGFVNLTDMDERTGGNVVIPGSHKQFTALAERFARDDPSGMIPWETVWKEAPEAFGTIVMAHCEAGGECSNGLSPRCRLTQTHAAIRRLPLGRPIGTCQRAWDGRDGPDDP